MRKIPLLTDINAKMATFMCFLPFLPHAKSCTWAAVAGESDWQGCPADKQPFLFAIYPATTWQTPFCLRPRLSSAHAGYYCGRGCTLHSNNNRLFYPLSTSLRFKLIQHSESAQSIFKSRLGRTSSRVSLGWWKKNKICFHRYYRIFFPSVPKCSLSVAKNCGNNLKNIDKIK